MTLGDLIKKYRTEHSLSMDAFSHKTGISKAYISLLEKNRHPKTGKPIAPSIQCIKQAADGMDMDFNVLFSMLEGNVSLSNDVSDSSLRCNRTIGDRIKKAIDYSGLSRVDLSDKINVSKQTLYKYENNIITNIPFDKIEALAKYTNTTPAYLMGWDEHTSRPSILINVLGRVAAGIPIDAVEDIVDTEEVPAEMAKGCELFGLRIKGDSMSPRILDGDTVIVRCQNDAETDEIVIALINGDDAVCKKLKKLENGIMLISANPAYEPLVFTSGEIDSIPVRIIGKVVELRGKL